MPFVSRTSGHHRVHDFFWPPAHTKGVLGQSGSCLYTFYLVDRIQGLYRDNGKENGNYYLGFRVYIGLLSSWMASAGNLQPGPGVAGEKGSKETRSRFPANGGGGGRVQYKP